MNRFTMWIAAGIWLLLPYVAFAATFNVDAGGAITTIQAGINLAGDGDEVVIADGTYAGAGNVNLDFGGKKITVRSANGPANVLIDGGGTSRGVWFHLAEDNNSVLEGVTIQNCSADYGAGMRIEGGSSPTIRNVRLMNNHATIAGGGVNVIDSGTKPIFENCTISNNSTPDLLGSSGGGIRVLNQADATIINSVIDSNSAAAGTTNGDGGGIYVANASMTLVGSTISDNGAGWVGGGITIRGSTSNPVSSTSVSIVGSWIFGNYAGYKGGGIRFDSFAPTNTVEVINTLFYDNDAAQDGAVIDSFRASPVFSNVTISGNLSGAPIVNLHTQGGPAATSTLPTNVTFVNSILWGNSDPVISTQADIDVDGNSFLFIDYSDVQKGAASWNAFTAGTGNIDLDPQFEDPASDNYRLQAGVSPAIDAGDNLMLPADTLDLDGDGDVTEDMPLDLDGNDRQYDDMLTADSGNGSAPIVDMGAFERSPDSGAIRFSAATRNVSEADGTVNLTVVRTGGTVGAVSVAYAISSGTASTPGDFSGTNGVLNWSDGDSHVETIVVNINDDTVGEANETFQVALTVQAGSGDATLGVFPVATVTITDNDGGIVAAGGGGGGGSAAGGSGGGGGGGGGCFIQSAASDTQISVWPIAMLLTGVIGMGWFLGRKNP